MVQLAPSVAPFFNKCRAYLIHFADFRPGIVDIGKNHRRSAEDTIIQRDAFIYANVVLNLTLVSDYGIGSNNNILSYIAVFANL
jgi:hypothetical protein